MKVKIFEGSYMNTLERNINSWMDDNPNAIIENIKQSSAQYINGTVLTVISIFYTVKPEEEETWP